jgi:malonate transporter
MDASVMNADLVVVFETILPVFFVVTAGWLCRKTGVLADSVTSGLLSFTIQIAAPVLLFRAMYRLDVGEAFDWRLMVGFYSGAILCFALAVLGARRFFGARPGESIAIGFAALFSNSLMLGVPISARAYGEASLGPNFAILSIHAPLCYLIGITAMEMSRADGRGFAATAAATVKAMFRNALTIGIAVGLAFNFTGTHLPAPVLAGVDMIARAALPVALFALGGALTRYRLREGIGPAVMIAALGLGLHPLVTFTLTSGVFGLPDGMVRAATVTAAMPPGVNAYVFAAIYARAVGTAASSILLATGLSVVTISVWLMVLGATGY